MSDDSGMVTVEYALVVLAVAGLAVLLARVLTGEWVSQQIAEVVQRALEGKT